MPIHSPADAIRAVGLAVREQRVELGEPSDRTAISIEDTIKREYERWMVVEDEEVPCPQCGRVPPPDCDCPPLPPGPPDPLPDATTPKTRREPVKLRGRDPAPPFGICGTDPTPDSVTCLEYSLCE